MAITDKQALVSQAKQLVARSKAGHLSIPDATISDTIVAGAVEHFSELEPYIVTGTLDGDGSAYSFLLTGLSSFTAGWSMVYSVEYPADSSSATQTPTYIDANDWTLYPERGTPTHLRFLSTTPVSGTANIKVTYTAQHTVSDSTITVPSGKRYGLLYLVACHVCRVYAATYGQTTDPNIDADVTDYRGKGNEWLTLADTFCKQASSILGKALDETGAASSGPAGAWVDIDTSSLFGQQVWRTSRQR